jgi:hypothetical protein
MSFADIVSHRRSGSMMRYAAAAIRLMALMRITIEAVATSKRRQRSPGNSRMALVSSRVENGDLPHGRLPIRQDSANAGVAKTVL